MFKKLTLAELVNLDAGRVHVAFDQAVARVVRDCQDRPGDKAPRKVLLQLAVVPVVGEDGGCEECLAEFQVKDTVPTRKSKTYSLATNRKGDLIYSEGSPSNVHQTTFDDIDQVTGRVNRGDFETDDESEE